MKKLQLTKSEVTSPFDHHYVCRLEGETHSDLQVYLNVKAILGHDRFYLWVISSSPTFKTYSVITDTVSDGRILLGEVVMQNTPCHVVTKRKEHYMNYRFHDYAFDQN